jgi:hypothetical protein
LSTKKSSTRITEKEKWKMKKIVTIVIAIALMAGLANAATPYNYPGTPDTPGPTNNFDSLDGTWDHDNGSDQWGGDRIGSAPLGPTGGVETMPNAGALTPAGNPAFLRIQDPRPSGGTGDNRKIYFAHEIDFGLDGAHLDFRVRLATARTGAIDEFLDGTPWPDNGKGYSNFHDGGKGNIAIREAAVDRMISFVLNEQDPASLTDDVLWVGDNTNAVLVGDFTVFHDFDVDIAAGGVNGWLVSVSMDGGTAQVFDIAGSTAEEDDYAAINYLTMAMGSTGETGAMDVDYFGAVPEPMTLSLLGLGGLALIRRRK